MHVRDSTAPGAGGGFLTRFADRFVPLELHGDARSLRRGRTAVGLGFAPVPVALGIAVESLLMLARQGADALPPASVPVFVASTVLSLCFAAVGLAVPFLLRRTGSTHLATNLQIAVAFSGLTGLSYFDGGLANTTCWWLMVIPVGAALPLGWRSGLFWLGMTGLAEVGLAWAYAIGLRTVVPPPHELIVETWIWELPLLGVLLFLQAAVHCRSHESAVASLAELREGLRAARGRADSADRSKSEFLASASHEIRTPMTSVLGFTDVLLERARAEGWADDVAGMLATIKRNGEHLLVIIDDILDLSKIAAGALATETRPYAPAALISDVLELLQVRARARGVELRAELEPSLPETVWGDPRLAKQILMNLVGNALKFTHRGSVVVRARLSAASEVPRLVLEVRDSGIGMSAEQRARLFTPFAQGDSSTTRLYGGTGLGLAICQRLVRLQGGSIEVESEPGRGSTFRVEVPAAARHAEGPRGDAPDTGSRPAPERSARPTWFDRAARACLPLERRDDPTALSGARLTLAYASLPMLTGAIWALFASANLPDASAAWMAPGIFVNIALFALIPAALRRTGSARSASHLLLAYASLSNGVATLFWNGAASPGSYWVCSVPMIAMGLVGVRGAAGWGVVSLAEIFVLYALYHAGYDFTTVLPPESRDSASLLSLLTLTGLTSGLTFINEAEASRVFERLAAANAEEERARRTAEDASHAKSDFLATMSHELRTPMTAILGFADLVAEQWRARAFDASAVAAIDTVRANARHLLAMIDDLLDLAKLEAGRLGIEAIPFAPADVARDTLELVRPGAERRGIVLALQLAPELPATVAGDPTRVRQILQNLVGALLARSALGTVRVRMGFANAADAARLTLSVEDDGQGVAPHELEQLFEPFAAAEAGGGAAPSTGLGLTLTRRLTERMGGTIRADHSPRAGLVFHVELPVAPPRAGEEAPPSRPTPIPAALDLRVLLADDALDNQRLLVRILSRAGCEVDVAANGAEAVEAAAEDFYDVILLDLDMPVVDGFEAARRLRAAGFPGAIIALTAHTLPEIRERCLAAGCDEFASKPIDRAALLGLLGELARKRRSRGH